MSSPYLPCLTAFILVRGPVGWVQADALPEDEDVFIAGVLPEINRAKVQLQKKNLSPALPFRGGPGRGSSLVPPVKYRPRREAVRL